MMKIGDVVSESLKFGVPWDEANKEDQTQQGVVFNKRGGVFHVLWFDSNQASQRTDFWSRSNSVKII